MPSKEVDRLMSEIGDWLAPAVAVLWILFRVLPRLFRAKPEGAFEAPKNRKTQARDLTGDPSPSFEPEKGRADTYEVPPPIEPR